MAPNFTEEENVSDMDRFLFIIRDHIPKEYVATLSMYIGNIGRVKDVVDYKAYISLEFNNKADASHASVTRTQALDLWANNQLYRYEFATKNSLVVYMNEMASNKGVGNGY